MPQAMPTWASRAALCMWRWTTRRPWEAYLGRHDEMHLRRDQIATTFFSPSRPLLG